MKFKFLSILLGIGLAFSLASTVWFGVSSARAENDLARQVAKTAQLEAQNARLGHDVKKAQKEATWLRRDLRLNYQALSSREAEKAALAADKQALKAQLNEVYNCDQKASDWSGTYAPDSVVDRVCGPKPETGSDTAALGLYARCTGARITNGQLLEWAIELLERLRLSNRDKAALRAWAESVTADD